MDLLFKRYASPFLLLNNLIRTRQLSSFIDKLAEIKEREDCWEFYTHRLPTWDTRTFTEFMADLKDDQKKTEPVSEEDLGTIVKNSWDIMKDMGDITNGNI